MQDLILQLAIALTPLIRKVIEDYKTHHGGAEPTDAEIHELLQANADHYLAQGQAWLAAHPKT